MMKRTIKHKWLKAKLALSQTMQRILDINRQRKILPSVPKSADHQKELQDELRLLNKLAQRQALIVQQYEHHVRVETNRD